MNNIHKRFSSEKFSNQDFSIESMEVDWNSYETIDNSEFKEIYEFETNLNSELHLASKNIKKGTKKA